MKRQEGVFNLIKSLTKQEKWYFKQFAAWNAVKGNSNYIKLFDIINDLEVYNETAIKRKVSKYSDADSFTETKYQLYQNILKSLHSYHLNASIDNRLKTFSHQIEILFNKALFDEAFKRVLKAKELAIKYERFSHLLDILERERQCVIFSYNFSGMEEHLTAIFQELRDTQEKLSNQLSYFQLSDRLYLIHSKNGVIRNEKTRALFDNVMNDKLLRNDKTAMTYEAKAAFYHCHKIYWFAMQNYKEYYFYCSKHLEVLEEKEHMIDDRLTRYIGSLYSLALAQIDIEDYANFPLTIQKMRAIPEKYKTGKLEINRMKIFDMSYRLELRFYYTIHEFDIANEKETEILAGIHKYQSLLTELSISLFYFELASVKFAVKDFKAALHYTELVLQTSISESREDIVSVIRILQLILHFEIGSDLLLPYIIKSTYRYLYKKERLFKMETIIMQYLRKSNKLISGKEIIKSFKDLKDELNLLKQDPYEKIGLEYVDFTGWLDSKIK